MAASCIISRATDAGLLGEHPVLLASSPSPLSQRSQTLAADAQMLSFESERMRHKDEGVPPHLSVIAEG